MNEVTEKGPKDLVGQDVVTQLYGVWCAGVVESIFKPGDAPLWSPFAALTASPANPEARAVVRFPGSIETLLRVSQLRPATKAKIRVSLDLDVALGDTSIDQFAQQLQSTLADLVNKRTLIGRADGSVIEHAIAVDAWDGGSIFTPSQRKNVVDRLVEDMVDSLSTNSEYAQTVARSDRTIGYDLLPDTALLSELHNQLGDLADQFDWAEDGQFDIAE